MNDPPLSRMDPKTSDRLGRPVSPLVFELLSAANRPWHEDAAGIRQGLKRGRENARRLAWVRSQMLFRLTRVERRCVELYYFENLTYREAAAVLSVNPTSVYRAVQRGLRKLRTAAQLNPPERVRSRRIRKGRMTN